MSEEPKTLSEKLRAARDEFNDLATRAKAAAGKLESAMWEAQSSELRAKLDEVLHQFIPTVDKSPLKGHDIVFLINKSEDMGEGFSSPIGAALSTASSLAAATGGHDVKVSAILWEGGSTKSVYLGDADRMEKARDKTKSTAKDLLPAVKEIMVGNTPDKQDARTRHYIIISPGNLTDNLDHSAQMINTAMQLNPRLTFDFVSFGDGNGNVRDLVAKLNQNAGNFLVQKHEDLNGVIMGILTTRFKGLAPARPVEAHEAEAANAMEGFVKAAAATTPAPEAAKPAAAPQVAPETPKAAEPPKAEPPKAETPVAAAAVAGTPATSGSKKKWYKPWARNKP